MKNLWLLITLFFTLNMTAQSDVSGNPLMSKYGGSDDFTTINISPKMFQLIAKSGIADEDPEVGEVINNISSLSILVYDNEDKAPRSRALYDEAFSSLVNNSFEELMTVKDGSDNVRFMIRENGNLIEQLLLLVGSEDEFVMIDISGNIDLEQISKLSKSMDVDGFEHLEKLGE